MAALRSTRNARVTVDVNADEEPKAPNPGWKTLNADFDASAKIKTPRKRADPGYDLATTGVKGKLHIPGVFKGKEQIVADKADDYSIERKRSFLGVAKRKETYVGVSNDKGELTALVRSEKTKSNPLRSRKVTYSETTDADGKVSAKRDMDVRFLGTKKGFKYTETDKGRQYTQIRAPLYKMDLKEHDNEYKKKAGLKQRKAQRGFVKTRHDVDADGNMKLTGFRDIVVSKYTDQISETKKRTAIKFLGGALSKTYEKPIDAKRRDNSDKFVTKRRIGTFNMKAEQGSATTDATKVQKLGHWGTFFKREVTIPREGDEKTVKTRIMGITSSHKVKLTESEAALRDKQVGPKAAPEVAKPRLGLLREGSETLKKGLKFAQKEPMQAASNALAATASFFRNPGAAIAASASYIAGHVASRNRDIAQANGAAAPTPPKRQSSLSNVTSATSSRDGSSQTPLVNNPDERSLKNAASIKSTPVASPQQAADAQDLRDRKAHANVLTKLAMRRSAETAQPGPASVAKPSSLVNDSNDKKFATAVSPNSADKPKQVESKSAKSSLEESRQTARPVSEEREANMNRAARWLASIKASVTANAQSSKTNLATPVDPVGSKPTRTSQPERTANADGNSVPREITVRSKSNVSGLSSNSGFESAPARLQSERKEPANNFEERDRRNSGAVSAPGAQKSKLQRSDSVSSISTNDLFVDARSPVRNSSASSQSVDSSRSSSNSGQSIKLDTAVIGDPSKDKANHTDKTVIASNVRAASNARDEIRNRPAFRSERLSI